MDEYFFPNGNEWIAGENVSVADFSYVATISTAVVTILIVLYTNKLININLFIL
jgi:hypothetical protein